MTETLTRRALMTGTAISAAVTVATAGGAEPQPEPDADQPQLLDTPHVRAYYARARS